MLSQPTSARLHDTEYTALCHGDKSRERSRARRGCPPAHGRDNQ
nr:MAG TPA: hypothetical protein [Caudoviricetes sp.]